MWDLKRAFNNSSDTGSAIIERIRSELYSLAGIIVVWNICNGYNWQTVIMWFLKRTGDHELIWKDLMNKKGRLALIRYHEAAKDKEGRTCGSAE